MFDGWGRLVYRRRRLVLVIALIVVAFAAAWGTGVFGRLQSSGGFTPPDSQSQQSSNLATAAFGRDAGDVVVLYSSPTMSARSPAFRAAVTHALAGLPPGRVESAATYWSTGSPQFISASGRETYAVLELAGASDGARQSNYDAIKGRLDVPGLRTEVGGLVPTNEAINKQVSSDIGRAEAFSVAVSGITVAMALASLMLFPEDFLRSMGYGGVATVFVDMLAALTVLPALLAVFGRNVNALRIRRAVRRPPAAEGTRAWYRIARSVMRRPVFYAVPIVVVLLALGSPFLRVTWGGTDATVLPASAGPRLVTEALNRDFPGNPTAPIESVVRFPGPVAGSPARAGALAGYVGRLDRAPGVIAARVTGVRGDIARVDMRYGPDPYSPQARAIVGQVRDVRPPPGALAYVGGPSAQLVDELSSLGQVLPWMALVVALATFVLLFLAFGSVVLPVKAIAMNVLSLSVMYGVVVWIFQEGHLSGLLRFTPNGTIDPTMPILMFAIMFGLSMDYEVFLLSRIRERYDVTGDNTAAVAAGLQRTGGLITSLALLLVIVVGAFSASGITFIKLLGVGMIVALVVDASIVRVLLVPAVMRLLGPANWWAPKPLRRLYARYGIHDAADDDAAARPRSLSAAS
jgi:uncharacterized membrane protein YdfJ with MMPL/SSD domain